MIRFDRLTVKSQEALAEAQRIAERAGHQQIDVEHWRWRSFDKKMD